MTKVDLFDYELPEQLIAQYPCEERDGSRLLVVTRNTGTLEDRFFSDLPGYLRAGDVLVLNDSRVIHTRLLGSKQETGAHIELFLLKHKEGDSSTWEALARPARRLKPGDIVVFKEPAPVFSAEAGSHPNEPVSVGLRARVIEKSDAGSVIVSLEHEGDLYEVLDRVGHVPLPPYIDRADERIDVSRYQTVFADEPGSVAAPTAGLHFTPELLQGLRQKGVEIARVTLHVGLGTFRPVQCAEIEDHPMHEEFYHISEEAAVVINRAKAEGRRVVCVGTTSVRTLESAVVQDPGDSGTVASVAPGWGSTDIFIYPGGRGFAIADALITNFHLPKSTLLMLVSAFYDREKTLEAYKHAVIEAYRFFSYGDAMFLQ
ncbi:MAG TPA: tRNA preQ1(34) S-adenosylmethionine ribosyltransferase-isomerase QueA [Coriobacteriia bacterium]|nr:tRNA preQ1(34) S-adenosylmethionine ribosyltransferase-isomerase QueA [Coriobacteriia bacterium]